MSKICADEGLAFDRSKTALAVRAHPLDLTEARLQLALKIAVRPDELLEDMDAPMIVHNFGGRENTWTEELIDSPTVEARQRMMTAVGIGFDKIARIVERSNDGVEHARGVLDDLSEGFRLAADQMRAEGRRHKISPDLWRQTEAPASPRGHRGLAHVTSTR